MGTELSTLTSHIYDAADAFDVRLNKTAAGYQGFTSKKHNIVNFWKFETDLVIQSDSVKDRMNSFFVRFSGNLWGYFISTHKGLWLWYFDGDRAKVRIGDIASFKTGDIKQTLKKLQPAGRDAYTFDPNTQTWIPFDVTNMVPSE